MNHRIAARTVCLLLIGWILAAVPATGQERIQEDEEGFTLSTEKLGVKILKSTGRSKSGGGVYLFDGRAKKDIALEKVSRLENANGALNVAWETGENAPAVECAIKPEERHISFALRLTNRSKEEQWIEARLRFFLKLPAACGYWDGFELHENPTAEVVHNKLRGKFPMCCAYADKAAVALGIEPSQYFSFLESVFAPGGEQSEIRFAVRVVIDPEKAETVSFILYSFDAQYGCDAALETYYGLFPAVFAPLPDVDPRVSDSGATYNAWTSRPNPEICRRFHAGWEWCYAPFKRTGDWLGKKEFWEYAPAREPSGSRKFPIEKFHEARKQQMLNGRLCNVAMMFYVPSCVWCEEKLARDVYPDALINDPTVTTYFDKPWVTGHDNELRVYPWGNKFGEACTDDMKKIADTLDIAGFAFDTAEGGAKYRGPGVKNSPGRAWDDEGVYCDEGVAIGKLMDFVHSLQKDGRRLAVVSNPTAAPVYICAFKSDSAMFEGTPWGQHGGVAPLYLRRFLGKKTLVWWEDFLLEKTATKWETMTPEQIRDAYLGLSDFVILKSAQIGGLPTPRISLGVPKIVKEIPALLDLVRAGWEPVTAATGDKELWLGRFGQSVDALISVGNASAAGRVFSLSVDDRRLGKCAYLLTPYEGGQLRSVVEQDMTKIDLQVQPRQLRILRAPIGIYPFTPVIATVSESRKADSGEIKIDLQTLRPGTVRFICRIPDDFRAESVMVNNQKVEHQILKGKLNFDAPIGEQTDLGVIFKSETFDSTEEQILNYAFVNDGKPYCEIVLRDDAAEEETYAARRIQLYFKEYYEKAASPKPAVEVPIRKASELKGDEKALVVIDGSEGQGLVQKLVGAPVRGEGRQRCVKLEKQETLLCISGATPAAARDATFRLLRVLDKQYPYYGGFPKSEAAEKAGIVGKILE